MSKLETPMILAYWDRVGGTLIEEFQLVQGDGLCGPRRADALILLGRERRRVPAGDRSVNVEGEKVVVAQAKAHRLGMYLMGQGVFSAELMKRFKPTSIKSIIPAQRTMRSFGPYLRHFPTWKSA